MNRNDYVKLAIRTESLNFKPENPRLLHAAMGLMTETVEARIAHSRENYVEELGDILWYCAVAADELSLTFDELVSFVPPGVATVSMDVIAGNLLDLMKKNLFYGRALARDQVAGLIGQLIEAVEVQANTYHVSLEELMFLNIQKLKKRYPQGFTELDAERRADVSAK